MRSNNIKICLLGLCVVLLTACSGSGGSSDSAPQTGRYKDAGAVAGVHYATATQAGTTGTTGEFLYRPGETVTFSIGSIVLGQATAAATVTTFDLVGITPPTTGLGIPNNTPASLSFQQVANISTLLQTLDEDSNPTNGIQVPAQAAPIATTNLTFYQPSARFNNSWSFRQFIGNCRTAGLWGGSRAIKKTGYAVTALYQGLGLTANLGLLTEESTQENGVVTRNVYTYDTNGNLINTERFNGSNVLQSSTTQSYDINGNVLTYVDYDANNQVTGRYTNSYNANGYNTGYVSYDASGNLAYQGTTTVDIFGNAIAYETYYAFNQSTYRQTLSWNNLGKIETVRSYNGNGTLTSSSNYTYTYNDTKISASREDTYDGNGVLTAYNLWTYNSFEDTLTYNAYNASNVLQVQMSNTYDSNGNLIQSSSQYSGNPTQYSSTFAYNTNGYETQSQYYNNQTLQGTTTYTYDANGNHIGTVVTGSSNNWTRTRTFSPTNLWQRIFNIYREVG